MGTSKTVKTAAVGGVAAAALLAGGLLFGGGLINAQEPSPTPGQQQTPQTPQSTPRGHQAPDNDGDGQPDDCPRDKMNGGSESSGTGFRRGGAGFTGY